MKKKAKTKQTQVSNIAGRFFTSWTTREAKGIVGQ